MLGPDQLASRTDEPNTRARMQLSLLEDYCTQLGTLLDRSSPGAALITAREQAQQRLLRAKASDEAKSKFLAHMSHELRTPVNGVLGMLELVSHTEAGPKRAHYLETARQSAELLLGIIDGVIDISKIEAGNIQLEEIPFDLREAIDAATGAFSDLAHSKGLEMTSTIPVNLPTALIGDPGRLQQILTNLVGNALKFTEKGEIGLRVQTIETNVDSAVIAFTVADTGVGIPRDKQRHIFDAFAQADSSTTRRYGGTGLGLAIAKQLCEMMGGSIELTSEAGCGSTFRFTARFRRHDLHDNQADHSLLTMSPQSSTPREKLGPFRVLVVEDNPINLEVACGMLENLGCQVDYASNGQEALEYHARGEYSLIFMDWQMPDMDGFQATAEIRRREAQIDKRVPIVALTASAIEGDREKCLAAGMDDYIPKPFTAEQICAALVKWTGFPILTL
jgi:two-component system, sensor histidine kinase